MSETSKNTGKTGVGRNADGTFNKDNPTVWKKGDPSPNPKGRANAITDIVRRLGNDKDNRLTMLERVYVLALSGEKWAVEFIAGYDQGKPVQTQITIEENREPIKIIDASD